ncbi:MAG: type II secretion system secretin GspD [Ideonella sp.]|nr:type II secretion system secretin GspD [Ideonella sp.]MCC7456291.1 type II secretion system secretin GspD [Nitrospira sp.]
MTARAPLPQHGGIALRRGPCAAALRGAWPAALSLALALTAAPAPAQTAAAANRPAGTAGTKGHSPALKSSAPVTVNFVNADIEAVTRAMAVMIERQIIVDPRVKGTITVYSEQPITVREAYLNYLAALRGLGFTLVDSAGLLKVVPEADAKLQAGTVSVGKPGVRGDQVLTQIFKLNHENPNNLVAVLRPLISPNNTINANPGNNTLVITDYADNLQRIGKIIAALDQPSATDVEVIPVRYGVASELAALVQRLGDGATAGAAVPGAAGHAAFTVLVDPRGNALIVRASSPARLASLRALIQRLDQPVPGAGANGNIWVVHLKNADATKLATVLRAAFTRGSGSSSSPVMASPAVATAAVAPGGGAGNTPATAPLAASAQPSTGGFIQADPATNSLIITAPEPLYREVRAMIEQLDSRRAQVYIESLIVEVSGDNAADFGFQWQGLIGSNGDKYGVFAGTNSTTGGPSIIELSKTIAGLGTTTPGQGLNIGVLKNYGGTYALAAIARMLQSQSNTNIVSAPNLITLDNEEAKIIVGSNVPFITGQFTNTGTATTSPFQTIERKDVGITLRIKPQVGEGGSVRMTIFQESSSVSDKVAPGTSNAGPSTDKRSIESTVVVDDGAILVLGGLIEDKFTQNNSKVPLLGDLPFVGGLFRSESRTRTRTNLMVFLRPVVMRDAESANKLSLDRYDLMRARQKDAQPAPSAILQNNDTPIIPPLRAPAASAPASTPPPLGIVATPAPAAAATPSGPDPTLTLN